MAKYPKKEPDAWVEFGEWRVEYYDVRHQYFMWRPASEEPRWVPSVTRVVKRVSASGEALIGWTKKKIREALEQGYGAVTSQRAFNTLVDHAIKAPERARDEAGEHGTRAHAFLELLAEGTAKRPAGPTQQALLEWWDSWEVDPVESETIVASPTLGMVGTQDLLAEATPPGKERGLYLLDLKTSTGVYPEHFAQVAAYRHLDAEMRELGGDEPRDVLGAYVLHLPIGATTVVPHEQADYEGDLDAFMATVLVHTWAEQHQISKWR
jgi:hypothetical protein